MPDLFSYLKTYDLSFLQSIADVWGVTAKGADRRAFATSLAKSISNTQLFEEHYESLPDEAREALDVLKQAGGILPWSNFTRHYGEMRALGPARRDREKPWYFPASISEHLYYHAMIGREFIRLDDEINEVAFIPDEFLTCIPQSAPQQRQSIMEQLTEYAAPAESEQMAYGLRMVDDYCTLFSALRLGNTEFLLAKIAKPSFYWRLLRALGDDLNLIGKDGLTTDIARAFLEQPKSESAVWLIKNWANTRAFNELRLTPALRCEGTWQNEPLPVRRQLLAWLKDLKVGIWYRLSDFVIAVEKNDPDFLRLGADYDVWMIYDRATSELLRGIKSWHRVEAAFLRFMITQWMAWLGLVYTFVVPSGEETFFTLTPLFAKSFIESEQNETCQEQDVEEPLEVKPNGLILMSDKNPAIARYQIARFAEWVETGPTRYSYQLTPQSLSNAAKAGLTIRHLLGLLRKYGRSVPPPSLQKALNRWQTEGGEAKIERLSVLRLKSPEILQALKKSDAKVWLGDSLGPVAVIVKAGGLERVQETLARLGYLSDYALDD